MGPNARLVAASLVCVLALGLGWQSSRASLGYLNPGLVLPTSNISPVTGDVWAGSQYYPGAWVEGDPMRAQRGFRSDVRVVLVPSAGVLWWAARARSDQARRAARVALAALVVIGVMALGRGMVAAAISTAVVVWLAGPVLWQGRLGLLRPA